MFERIIYKTLVDTIDALVTADAQGKYPKLHRILAAPGREAEEVDKLLTFLTGDGKPHVRHGYGMGGTPMPVIAIVLGNESVDQTYLGNLVGDAGDEAEAFVAEVEKEVGHPVEAAVKRYSFTFNVFIYAENPDVALALYNLVRDTFLSQERALAAAGMETPMFSGMDLAPDPRYVPENIYVRMFSIQAYGHVLYSYDVDLGQFASGKVTKIGRVHVANNVTGDGLNPGVTVFDPDE